MALLAFMYSSRYAAYKLMPLENTYYYGTLKLHLFPKRNHIHYVYRYPKLNTLKFSMILTKEVFT